MLVLPGTRTRSEKLIRPSACLTQLLILTIIKYEFSEFFNERTLAKLTEQSFSYVLIPGKTFKNQEGLIEFPNAIDSSVTLDHPILFSNTFSKNGKNLFELI